jgi:ABC-type branched-subunit amino acid transport system substrate-binding protein
MTIRQRRLRAVTLVSAAVLAAATGCSTKAPTGDTAAPQGGGGGGEVQTGRGIEGDTITLGVLTDLTGVFAALGKDITNAQTMYWDKVNAEGGVCDRFQVELDVKDHGYVTQQGVQLYSGMRSDVLALQHTIASPINTALEPQLVQDHMVNFPAAWAQSLTKNEQNAVVGATYEIEMINVLDYLLKQGKIKEGDKIGHIYFEGEYGAGGLAGSKYFADKHGMTIVEQKIKSTDTDMTAQVTQFKAQGVAAIALTVAPGQTASAAGVAAAQGLNVPIAGNNPVFAPGLLAGPAGPALKQNLFVASPVAPFDKEPELLAEYQAKYPGNPTLGVVFGTATANVMQQILENACEAGDLTPEGVTQAKTDLGETETGGLSVPLNFEVGESPSLQSYIFQAADVPGGAKSVEDLYQGEDAEGFTPAE